ncbi:lymphocyte antigen 6H-like [Sorex araneus]|uniref:lymphocyte antigen 6H-like n=1 Tax=Sorex araneus TaxID=42254 RepID=UPI0003317D53|nr:lymphocyte antigen 6H-like [Sorex araneus]
MRGAQLVLLVTLLCPCALSLRCHTCLEIQRVGRDCQLTTCVGLRGGDGGVCYTSNLTITTASGRQAVSYFKGCAASCEVAQKAIHQLARAETLHASGVAVQLQLESTKCCEQDLCNAGPQGLASALLLLGLGPLLLALL